MRERDHFGESDLDGMVKWIFRKRNEGVWTGSSWLRIGSGGGHL
jgi:hypothetical protein